MTVKLKGVRVLQTSHAENHQSEQVRQGSHTGIRGGEHGAGESVNLNVTQFTDAAAGLSIA